MKNLNIDKIYEEMIENIDYVKELIEMKKLLNPEENKEKKENGT